VAWTGSGHILGDETDSIGALSGGLATETDSIGIPASGGIAMETDIMGRPALGRSLYTEYTVYRYTYLDILLPNFAGRVSINTIAPVIHIPSHGSHSLSA